MKISDIKIGNVFSRLTIVGTPYTINKRTWAKCKCECECDSTCVIRCDHLLNGNTKSCGCLQKDIAKEMIIERSWKHGYSSGKNRTRIYRIWRNMMNRCYLPTLPAYKDYGGRGILVCDRWHEFLNFLEDCEILNTSKLTIDRIDNNKGYSPENCRFVTAKVQTRNTRTNTWLKLFGKTRLLVEWAEQYNVKASVLRKRLKRGHYLFDALTRPFKARHKAFYLIK